MKLGHKPQAGKPGHKSQAGNHPIAKKARAFWALQQKLGEHSNKYSKKKNGGMEDGICKDQSGGGKL